MHIIFDKNIWREHIRRAYKQYKPDNFFLHAQTQYNIAERLSFCNKKFNDILIYGLFPDIEHMKNLNLQGQVQYADIAHIHANASNTDTTDEVYKVDTGTTANASHASRHSCDSSFAIRHANLLLFDEEHNPLMQQRHSQMHHNPMTAELSYFVENNNIVEAHKHIEHNNLSSDFDLIISNLTLQFANDLVGALIQYYNILRPAGLFIAAIFGGQTLHQLRYAMLKADQQLFNTVYPRVVPMIDIKQGGSILQRAGFAMPVADTQTIEVAYSSLHKLLCDLQYMGLNNCMHQRGHIPIDRRYFSLVEEIYRAEYSENNKLIATFEVIYLCGSKD